MNVCSACFSSGTHVKMRCTRCRRVVYCSDDGRTCQKIHWKEHRKVCGKVTYPEKRVVISVECLTSFLEEHSPKRLKEIPHYLRQYRGNHQDLSDFLFKKCEARPITENVGSSLAWKEGANAQGQMVVCVADASKEALLEAMALPFSNKILVVLGTDPFESPGCIDLKNSCVEGAPKQMKARRHYDSWDAPRHACFLQVLISGAGSLKNLEVRCPEVNKAPKKPTQYLQHRVHFTAGGTLKDCQVRGTMIIDGDAAHRPTIRCNTISVPPFGEYRDHGIFVGGSASPFMTSNRITGFAHGIVASGVSQPTCASNLISKALTTVSCSRTNRSQRSTSITSMKAKPLLAFVIMQMRLWSETCVKVAKRHPNSRLYLS